MFLNFEFPPLLYYMRSNPDTFPPGTVHMSRRRIDFFDLLVVFKGTLHLWEDGDQFDIEAGQFLILEPNKRHYGHKPSEKEAYYFWLHFNTEGTHYTSLKHPIFLDYENLYQTLTFPKFGDIRNANILHEQFKELSRLHTYSNTMHKLQQQTIFQQMLPHLLSQEKYPHTSLQILEIAEATMTYLEKNFRNNITYDTLSRHFNFTSTYIVRCFKNIYHVTPLDYLKNIRLKEAKFILAYSNASIEHISLEVGFNSVSYFSRTFTKAFGVSPLQYRKAYSI